MKNKIKHRSILIFTCILSFFVLFGTGWLVYASLQVQEEQTRQYVIGDVESTVQYSFEAPAKLVADTTITNGLAIKNEGTVSQFVRVMLLPEAQIARATPTENVLALPLSVGMELELIGENTTQWRLGEDGYYYYLEEVEADSLTSELFTGIKTATTLPSDYVGADFSLTVKVEATVTSQYRKAWWGNTDPTNDSLRAIDGVLTDVLTN